MAKQKKNKAPETHLAEIIGNGKGVSLYEKTHLLGTLDAVYAPIKVWAQLAAQCEKGDVQAIKTWLAYRYGLPSNRLKIEHDPEPVPQKLDYSKLSEAALFEIIELTEYDEEDDRD